MSAVGIPVLQGGEDVKKSDRKVVVPIAVRVERR